MKRIFISTCLAALTFAVGSGTAIAQEDGSKIVPVELYTCTYNARKGPADLDKWAAKWNAWADAQGIDNYAAWTLTPYYYGPGANADFDVIWMGAGTDAVALGKAQDTWLATNGGLSDEVFEIITCGSHGNYASANFKAPPSGATPGNSVLTFSDCKLKDGATGSAVNTAMAKWRDHLEETGSTAGIWHWYAAYGGGGEDFDFKWLEAYANLEDLGADYESFGNGRGFEKYGQLFGHLMSCDSSRAYLAESRRFVQLR